MVLSTLALLLSCLFPSSSAGKLRAKADRTMVALRDGKGIASFCRRGSNERAKPGKIIAARGSVRFAGQRP